MLKLLEEQDTTARGSYCCEVRPGEWTTLTLLSTPPLPLLPFIVWVVPETEVLLNFD